MPGTGAVPHPGHHLARLQELPLTEVPPAGGLVLGVRKYFKQVHVKIFQDTKQAVASVW